MWSVLLLFSSVYHFSNLSHCVFVLFCRFLLSSLLPPAHTSSCPMVLTTTARSVPPTCIATGEVWAQGQALPSPSSPLPPHPTPPPPAPLAHGHVLPQPCCQTKLIPACWAPQWCLHHESPAGRFVHHLSLGSSYSKFV